MTFRVVAAALLIGCGSGQHPAATCGSAAALDAPPAAPRALATATTPVTLAVTGLAAWQPGSRLDIVAPGTRLDVAVTSQPTPGTSLDWAKLGAPLVGGGDVAWVTQSSPQGHYRQLVAAGPASGFAVADGKPATLTAALTTVAPDKRFALHWKGGVFGLFAASAAAGAKPADHAVVAIKAVPAADVPTFAVDHYIDAPALVAFDQLSGSADSDEIATYGDPFAGSGYAEIVTMLYAQHVPIASAAGSASVDAVALEAVPVTSLAGGILSPAVTPPQHARIGAASLDQPQAGVGTSPTIAWDAPATGAVTGYTVTVRSVAKAGTGSAAAVTITTIGTLHAAATARSVGLPCNLLVADTSYVVTITAIVAGPGGLPYASADYVSAAFVP